MTFMTASQWYGRGFLIRRGARSEARDRWGRPMFTEYQVRPRFTLHLYSPSRRYIDARGHTYYV